MTPAGRAWRTTSPRPTAPRTATAPTGSTWRPPPTRRTTPARGAYDIGWTTPGQWFNYTVNVATAGTYTVAFRLASPYGITDALHIANAAGTSLSGSVAVPNTGGYETWTTVDASVTLPAGQQTLTVDQDSNGWNFHYMTFTLNSGGGGGDRRRLGGDQPFGGTPAAVPGTVQVANYDTGGQGVAYNVTAANGTANSYRSDGVDLESHRGHAGHQPGRRRLRHGLDQPRAVVQLHRRSRHRRELHGQLPGGLALRDHRRAAHRQLLRHQPDRRGRRPEHRRLRDLDHGHRQRHACPPAQQTLTVDQDSNGWNFHYLAFTQGSGGGRRRTGGGTGPTEYCGTQDLALDQPTTASSTQAATDYPASDATDGDPGTRWSSASSDPQWLEVDLGAQQQICSVGIHWEAAYASAFQIQVSNDNSTWTTVYSTTTGTGGNQTFPISATARYIRMYGTARATQFGDSIFEFDVYGLTTTAPVTGGNGNGGNGSLPVGRLHRAGRPAGPAGAQHHGPVGRGQPALR